MSVIYVDKKQRRGNKPLSDLSVWSLVSANVLAMIWALIAGWPLTGMMWVYWIQSISIGTFWFVRILTMKNFIEGLESKVPTITKKIKTVGNFLIGYAGFHLVYAGILWFHMEAVPVRPLMFAGGIFILNGFFSFLYNKVPGHKKQELQEFIFFPMVRIFPMHLTIFLGVALRDLFGITFGGKFTILFFLLLKTVVDVSMYLQERRIFYQ